MRAIIRGLQTEKGKTFLETSMHVYMDPAFTTPTDEEYDFAIVRIAAMLDQAIAVREGELILKRKPDEFDRRIRGY